MVPAEAITPHWRRRGWLIAVFVTGCITHGSALAWMRNSAPDAAEYIALGRALSTSGELVLPSGDRAKRMPAYPLLVAAVNRFTGDEGLECGIICVQTGMALCSTLMIAMIARLLASPAAGLIAGTASAWYAPFIYLQTLCLTETMLVFSLTAALLAFLHFTLKPTGRLRFIWVAAVFMAICAMTRANAAILLLPMLVCCLGLNRTWQFRTACVAILLLPTVFCLGAWTIRNGRILKSFTVSTTSGLNFFLGHNPAYAGDPGLGRADYQAYDRLRAGGMSEIDADRHLANQGLEWATRHPIDELVNLLRKLWVYHCTTLTQSAPTLVLILFIALLVVCWRLSSKDQAAQQLRRIFGITRIATLLTIVAWILIFQNTLRPWINPAQVVPLGLVGLFLLPRAAGIRTLFLGLYLAQMMVGIVYIPLERLRWTVDCLLIIAIGVAFGRLCQWLRQQAPRASGRDFR